MTLEQQIVLVPMTIVMVLWLIVALTPDKSKRTHCKQ